MSVYSFPVASNKLASGHVRTLVGPNLCLNSGWGQFGSVRTLLLTSPTARETKPKKEYWIIENPNISGSIIPYNHQPTGVLNIAHTFVAQVKT